MSETEAPYITLADHAWWLCENPSCGVRLAYKHGDGMWYPFYYAIHIRWGEHALWVRCRKCGHESVFVLNGD